MPQQICHFVMFSNLKLGKIRHLLLKLILILQSFCLGGLALLDSAPVILEQVHLEQVHLEQVHLEQVDLQ